VHVIRSAGPLISVHHTRLPVRGVFHSVSVAGMHPFRAAVEAGDFAAIPALCTEDVVFRSPIAHKPYQGRDTLGVILQAVSRVFEDLRYTREIGGPDDSDHALVFIAKV